MLPPVLIISFILGYFLLLMGISWYTGKKSGNNDDFFLAGKKSPWFIVAFGMIGSSLSGVTFVSIPGWVKDSSFSYMQVVLGYMVGYFVIATILMPLYYRLNLTSIYTYLEQRFGYWTYKTGASFFLLSRTLGSALRLFLVANVLQLTVFNHYNIPFAITVLITIAFIWLYTFKGGIKTIIWTDTLQTLFMLTAVGVSIWIISSELGLGPMQMVSLVSDSEYSRIFFFDDINSKNYFWKQFLSGTFIAIVMTGLDQDMMQKNLSCKSIKDAQKNMFSFSLVLLFVNLFFMALGALLYLFATSKGIALPAKTDDLYPMLATQGYLSAIAGIFFIVGLIAAAYSSADSAMTALTTSVCIDFLDLNKNDSISAQKKTAIRRRVHILISVIMVLVILTFKAIDHPNVISTVFIVAGYTYGPLLGMYAFGLFSKYKVMDNYVPYIAIISPILCFLLSMYSERLFNGYQFGFELLILNGLFTFIGLFAIKIKPETKETLAVTKV
ncbi:MAG: sodium:solute symporter [Bacteroidetes bacterium]|nr:sodium:solute symporter [Bacteroidota bacterium]HET6243399.1 sodium:solute symporter [Bacteroidia bacterium]